MNMPSDIFQITFNKCILYQIYTPLLIYTLINYRDNNNYAVINISGLNSN